jgi:hypothetical protein
MKFFHTTALILCCLIASFSISAQQIVGPETAFDATEAKALLEPGKSSIKGIAYYAPKSKMGIPNVNRSTWKMHTKEEVFLYPMTKHLEEWKKMRKKITYGKRIYQLSDECMKYYKSTFTDEYGKFEIKNIKPGKYWVWTSYLWSGDTEGDEKWLRFEKFVEITADGEVLDIKLNN